MKCENCEERPATKETDDMVNLCNGCFEEAKNAMREVASASPPQVCDHKRLLIEPCDACGREAVDIDGDAIVAERIAPVSPEPPQERMYVCLKCGAESWRIPTARLTRCDRGECSGQIVANPRRG